MTELRPATAVSNGVGQKRPHQAARAEKAWAKRERYADECRVACKSRLGRGRLPERLIAIDDTCEPPETCDARTRAGTFEALYLFAPEPPGVELSQQATEPSRITCRFATRPCSPYGNVFVELIASGSKGELCLRKGHHCCRFAISISGMQGRT